MGINEFYSFGSKLVPSAIQVQAIELKQRYPTEASNTNLLDQNKLIECDYTDISFPVLFKKRYGKKLQDVLDTGWPSLYLISENMKQVFEENDLTGWKAFDVRVIDEQENEIRGYFGLSITGRCDAIDFNKSEIFEKRRVPTGPLVKFYKGIYIDEHKWDSSDFFIPARSRWILTSKKIADLLKKSKLTNVRIERLSDIEIDYSTVHDVT